ncbi:MAG: ChaN family lipoprotein [Gemmatales bacterium]
MLSLILLCLTVDPVPASSYKLIHTRTGKELTLVQLADELASRDVIFFGELHDNVVGHQVYAELATLLSDRRSDMVIAMEMFERDVQGVVNDYLRGKLDEAGFLKHSRPWKDYARDYRPLIELARARKLDVIAGNLPRPVASRVASKEGSMSPYLPRKLSAPNDRYRELFDETMKGHPGAEGMVERMYLSQCAKDDAMAEGMADYLLANPHRQPLVIHCNGNFHSDYGLGTATRLAQRVPLAQQSIISMVGAVDINKADLSKEMKKAHYLLIVPKPPEPPKKTEAKPAEKTAPPKK